MKVELSSFPDGECPYCKAALSIEGDESVFIGEETAKCPRCGKYIYVSQYLQTTFEKVD